MNILGKKPAPPQGDPLLLMGEVKWQEKQASPVAVKARRREGIRLSEMTNNSRDINSRAKKLLPQALAALNPGDSEAYQAAAERCARASSEHAAAVAELAAHEDSQATAKSAGGWRLELHGLKHKTAVMEDALLEAQATKDRLEGDLRTRLRASVAESIKAIDEAYKELRAQQKAEVLALCADREPLARLTVLLERKPLEQLLGGDL